jgi:peptidoglycan/xylan/chitin deacetylase (PgdA/CDA1 family)
MRIPGLKTLRHSARWLRSRFTNGALILGYHRIANVSKDPFDMCIGVDAFAGHLKILRQLANPISLEKLVDGLRKGNLPERAVAITFDDGYNEVLYRAKPLLECYQIPATVFVTTDYIGREFWWDRLEGILFSSESLSQQISLVQSDGTYQFRTKHSNDIPATETTSDQKQQILLLLYEKLLPLSSEQRASALAELGVVVQSELENPSNICALTPDEIIELTRGGLVDVGAHSSTHPCLADLSVSEQRAEINGSKKNLEKILGHPVIGFSYPNGSFTAQTQAIVRDSGFHFACASESGVAWRSGDLFRLPRFWISDLDGAAFLRWLNWWLRG